MNSLTKTTNSGMNLDQYRTWKEEQVRYIEQLEYYLELFGLPRALRPVESQKLLTYDRHNQKLLGYEELSQDDKVETMLNQLVVVFDVKSVDVSQVTLSLNATQIEFLNLVIQMNQFSVLQAYIESQEIDVVMVYVYLLELKSGSSVNVSNTSEAFGQAVGEVVSEGSNDSSETPIVIDDSNQADEPTDEDSVSGGEELIDEDLSEKGDKSKKNKLRFRLPSVDIARLMKYLPWLVILALLAGKCDDDHSDKNTRGTECPPVVECPPEKECGYSYPSIISVGPFNKLEEPVKKPELPIVDGEMCEDVAVATDNGNCLESVDRDVVFPQDFPESYKDKIIDYVGVCIDAVIGGLCEVEGDVSVLGNGNTMLNGKYLSGTGGKCFNPVR